MRDVLLVDLDGTLTDPAAGIVGCFRFALAEMGRAAPPGADLTWIIGPPLRRSFAEMLEGTGDPEQALAIYRRCYSSRGLFEAVAYDGVRETLIDLKAMGVRLFLCTSKPLHLRRAHSSSLRARPLFRVRLRLRAGRPSR
jgi:phosphoglycolate phosphatase